MEQIRGPRCPIPMKRAFKAVAVAVLLAPSGASAKPIAVSVFAAKTADVNAFVLSDHKGAVIVDATRNSADALELAAFVRKKGVAPKTIFITHGHPDHFVGLAALKKEFPEAKILVAGQAVKDDILAMAAMKWMDAEMKPLSKENPDGFDYGQIEVMDGKVLVAPGGGTLEVVTDFPQTEAAHETVLFSKERNALFASDLAYNKVHLWLAGGVTEKSARDWQAALDRLEKTYRTARVYPGHGAATDARVFAKDKEYIDDLFAAVKAAKTEDEAKARMLEKYPDWGGADFLLTRSVQTQFKQR
jgi:glyoxylase-like metal-dependent hydrolase (beta-lactamase superfamily II)